MKDMQVFLIIAFILFFSNCTKAKENDKKYKTMRKNMINTQLIPRGIADSKVINAMEKVERHRFVPDNLKDMAYNDSPLPIGFEQTISQPYIVAYMTEVAHLNKDDKVLEIGTGSGYQAAVLAEIVSEVYTIEIVKPLGETARNF